MYRTHTILSIKKKKFNTYNNQNNDIKKIEIFPCINSQTTTR